LAAWLVAGMVLLFATQLHAAESVDVKSREAVEQVIREYILRNPEIIHEALQALQVRQREAEQQRVREIISGRRDELFRDPRSPVGGNPSGDVTVVEFFDYRCPHCKSVAGTVKR
jgi:protein-disulfide isomerase